MNRQEIEDRILIIKVTLEDLASARDSLNPFIKEGLPYDVCCEYITDARRELKSELHHLHILLEEVI